MKLEPVAKTDKRNKTTKTILTMTLCQKIVTSLPFFGFMANLEQSGSRIPDILSIKLSLTVIFCLTKTQLSYYCFE